MVPEVANWVVGFAMVSIAVLKVLWGLDMVVTELLLHPPWWRLPWRSGDFWLGNYFLLSAVAVYGVIGWLLMQTPGETVELWYAVPILIAGLECGLAWFLLSRQKRKDTA